MPNADLDIDLRYDGDQRVATLTANNHYGCDLLSQLELC
ncbi:ATPase [Vibrio cholerae]|nr:ATPase [Vibrio cholerae]